MSVASPRDEWTKECRKSRYFALRNVHILQGMRGLKVCSGGPYYYVFSSHPPWDAWIKGTRSPELLMRYPGRTPCGMCELKVCFYTHIPV